MSLILAFKFVHVTTVISSVILFSIRAHSVFANRQLHQTRFFRLAPHINDTVLLISALGMVFILQQYPFEQAWLTVKIVFLLLYIVLGMAFMKWVKSKRQRLILFVTALGCYFFIVSVAVTRQPLGVFAQFVN